MSKSRERDFTKSLGFERLEPALRGPCQKADKFAQSVSELTSFEGPPDLRDQTDRACSQGWHASLVSCVSDLGRLIE